MTKARMGRSHEADVVTRSAESTRAEWEAPQGVRVGAAHDPAEHAADTLASQVLHRLSGGGSAALPAPEAPARDTGGPEPDVQRATSSGGMAGEFEADPVTSADMQSRAGKGQPLDSPLRGRLERGFGTSLAGVNLHTDAGAGRLADNLGAEAFTRGRDVFFGKGRYRPETEAGTKLLVHELAHVVQGDKTVRRKLKGTLKAVEEGKAKAGAGEKFFRTDYGKIVTKLKAYEKREDQVLTKKNFGRMGDDRFWMERTLRDILKLIDEWLEDNDKYNDPEKRDAQNSALWGNIGNRMVDAKSSGNDARVKELQKELKGGKTNQRARALTALRPRIAVELQDLSDPVSYFQGKQLDDTRLDKTSGFTKDDAVGGAQNRLDQVQYKDGKKGFFIAEKSNNTNIAQGSFQSRIDQVDPQVGARSVASSRLAKLFGSSEIVDVQFATHTSKTDEKGKPLAKSLNKMGVVSEVAEGSEAASLKYSTNDSERKDLGKRNDKSKVVDINDPTLQRSLNVLQMLDYLSLQIDRHTKNFYIATDAKGKVLGIKGIDLDLSFGQRGKDGDVEADQGMGHFVGVPQLADAKFRQKVLTVTPAEISKCLDGLLPASEVAACLERFAHLQKVMRSIDPSKIVQEGGWGKETAQEQIGQKNYVDKLRLGTVEDEYAEVVADLTRKLDNNERAAIRERVRPMVDKGALSVGQGKAVVKVLANSFQTSPFWEQLRSARDAANVERQGANAEHERLLEDKKSLAPEADSKDLDERIMLAELAKDEKAALNTAKGKAHTDAVESFVKAIIDYAIRRASRQKPKIPNRPPPPVPTKPRQLTGVGN